MKYWTKEEEQFLRDNYIEMGAKFCARKLNRDAEHIYDKVKRIRLIKHPKYEKIRPKSKNINILIPWEDYDNLGHKDIVPVKCYGCGKITNKTKHHIHKAIKDGFNGIFCSTKCVNEFQKREFLENIPSQEILESLINEDLTEQEIGVKLGKNYGNAGNYISRCLKFYGLQTNYKRVGIGNHPKTKAKIGANSKEYIKLNPNCKFLQGKSYKWISIPCEKVKNQLKQRGIDFKEELMLLSYLGLKYRADIVFEDYGTIIEINGQQHYGHDGKLTLYYQKRHDDFVNAGWKVYEISCVEAMKYDFLDKIIPEIFNVKNKISPEYKLFLPKKYHCKCGKEICKQSKFCWKCLQESRRCPIYKERLHWMIWNMTYPKICEFFNIGMPLLDNWINSMNFSEKPTDGYRSSIRSGRTTDYQI